MRARTFRVLWIAAILLAVSANTAGCGGRKAHAQEEIVLMSEQENRRAAEW